MLAEKYFIRQLAGALEKRGSMEALNKKLLERMLVELCPEIEELGLYPVIVGKGKRY